MNERLELNGLSFKVEIKDDDSMREPWKEHEGHGVVSEWTTRSKSPGERILNKDRTSYRYYDFAETVKMALKDGWGSQGDEGLTNRQKAAKAVERDYERMKAWCEDEWRWVGVIVTLLDLDGEETKEKESLWGIESNSKSYLDVVAKELAEEIAGRVEGKSESVKVTKIRKEVA